MARFEIDENVARMNRVVPPTHGPLASAVIAPFALLLIFLAYALPIRVILLLL